MGHIDQWKNKIIKGSLFDSGVYDESYKSSDLAKMGVPYAMACFSIGDNEIIAVGMERGNQSPRDFIKENQNSEFILDTSKPWRPINTMFGQKIVHYAKKVSTESSVQNSLANKISIDFRNQFNYNWNDLQEFINSKNNPTYHLSGSLQLENSPIKSLGTVVSIDDNVNLSNSAILDLGRLEKITKEFLITNTNLTTLNKLREVGYYLDAQDSKLESLGDLEVVDGYLDLQNTRIRTMGNVKSVNGYLDLKGTPIEDLANLEFVNGHLNLAGTPIRSLGKLKKVTGNIFLENTPLKSLNNLSEVGGDLVLGSETRELGDLKFVGNNLFMDETRIPSLGQLKHVGGWLIITNSLLSKTLTETEIRGKVHIGKSIKN